MNNGTNGLVEGLQQSGPDVGGGRPSAQPVRIETQSPITQVLDFNCPGAPLDEWRGRINSIYTIPATDSLMASAEGMGAKKLTLSPNYVASSKKYARACLGNRNPGGGVVLFVDTMGVTISCPQLFAGGCRRSVPTDFAIVPVSPCNAVPGVDNPRNYPCDALNDSTIAITAWEEQILPCTLVEALKAKEGERSFKSTVDYVFGLPLIERCSKVADPSTDPKLVEVLLSDPRVMSDMRVAAAYDNVNLSHASWGIIIEGLNSCDSFYSIVDRFGRKSAGRRRIPTDLLLGIERNEALAPAIKDLIEEVLKDG